MTKFIPAVPRLTAKRDGDSTYCKPSFSYYIDPDKTGVVNGHPYHGVVVAKLSGGFRNLANLCTKRDAFRICELEKIASALHVNSDLGPAYSEFEGKAYCLVNDEWDENEGMKIARCKAWIKYYNALANYTYNYKKRVDELSKEIDKYAKFAMGRYHKLNIEVQKCQESSN